MTKLIKAILDSDINAVRQILKTERHLIGAKNELGQLPIEVSKNKGLKKIEAIFIINTDWRVAYSITELKELLVDFIAELSEDTYSAGWLLNIEFELWNIINHKADPGTVALWQRRGDLEAVEDLKALKDITKSWAMWDTKIDYKRSVDLTEWNKIVRLHSK